MGNGHSSEGVFIVSRLIGGRSIDLVIVSINHTVDISRVLLRFLFGSRSFGGQIRLNVSFFKSHSLGAVVVFAVTTFRVRFSFFEHK
jgi:hypothetical protein